MSVCQLVLEMRVFLSACGTKPKTHFYRGLMKILYPYLNFGLGVNTSKAGLHFCLVLNFLTLKLTPKPWLALFLFSGMILGLGLFFGLGSN